jgi:hypothetical protein
MNRRRFLQTSFAAALVTSLRAAAPGGRPPRILLRSSWQVVNIGDIAHTPGALALIERYLPEAECALWASADLSPGVAAMMQRRFPKLRIVKGQLDEHGHASSPELAENVAWADFLLHGSGASLVAAGDVAAFARHTGKPYGVYGITHGSFFSGARDKDILSGARFAFFRDSVSLARAKADGVTCPVMEFGPDGAFACDVRDDAAAAAFLSANHLQEGKFLCCIPRLRWTPYWEIHGRPMDARAKERHARNEAMASQDHAPLREAIANVLRETDITVLVCPEDMSQMAVGKRWIVDSLPAQLRKRVVWRERFWLTDEALSTYRRSAGLFGLEMHSPIMCVGSGVPAIVARFAEQTSKGIMWRDIGLGDWLFDFDMAEERKNFAPAVLALATDPVTARAKAAKARAFVEQRQRETMNAVRNALQGA